MSALLSITWLQKQLMVTHIQSCLPEEGCGLLGATHDGLVVSVFPITNELHSQKAFRMAPQEQIKAFLQLEKDNLVLIAVYHSHPNGPAWPSESDIDQFSYPGVIQLIWSFQNSIWQLNGFIIKGRLAHQGTITLIEET